MPGVPEYRIWGRIEAMPPSFVAIACAVLDDASQPTSTRVLTRVVETREQAEQALRDQVISLGRMLRENGARVVDVETDGI